MFYRHSYDRYGWKDGKGGYTIAADFDKKVIGISICSKKDFFCKKTGRLKAIARTDDPLVEDLKGEGFLIFAPQALSKVALIERSDAVLDAVELVVNKFPQAGFIVLYGDD